MWMRRDNRLDRRLAGCALIASALACGACTLPYEQLSLPGPITGSIGSGHTSKSGLPLSPPGSKATKEERTYAGSGEYTAAEGSGSIFGSGDSEPAKKASPSSLPSASSATASGSAGVDGITLNLANASIADAARIVLGESLGVNYVISDKVKATITLRTVKPVDKAGLIEIFDAVLRGEGAALVAEGGLYKIVPANEAAAGGAPLQRGGQRIRQQVGIGTEVVPLRYVSAVEMERILRSSAPQANVLRVDSARNLLMISGTHTELQSMDELISVFDVDWMRGMSFAILPIETSDVDAIAQELDAVFANDRDSPTKGIVRFVPNKRLKSILVISSRPEYLRKAETWLKRIDTASRATEKQVNVYHVQHRPAAELAALLQKVYFSREGGRGGSVGGSSRGSAGPGAPAADASVLSPGQTNGGSSGGSAPFAPPSIQAPAAPGFAGAGSSGDAAKAGSTSGAPDAGFGDVSSVSAASENGRSAIGGGVPPDDRNAGIGIIADDQNNSLVITATASEYKRMRQILASVDTASTQVLLEATIAEVTLNDDLKFGVRWFLQKGGSAFSFTDVANVFAPTAGGFNYFLNFANAQVVFNALNTVSDVNVISSPSLMVVENKKAVLQVGNEVPIATQSAVSTTIAGAPIVNSISYRNTGVILGITPRVSDDGQLLLDIEQEVSSVANTTTSGIDSPTIQQRRVKTTVTVRDGQTVVLAGLIQDNSNRTRNEVPLIGTIPVLGNAFKNKDDNIQRTELLIAITPQIVRSGQQIDSVTAEYRDRLNFSTRPQRTGPPGHAETLNRIVR